MRKAGITFVFFLLFFAGWRAWGMNSYQHESYTVAGFTEVDFAVNAVCGVGRKIYTATPMGGYSRSGAAEPTMETMVMMLNLDAPEGSKERTEMAAVLPGVVMSLLPGNARELYALHILDTGEVRPRHLFSAIDIDANKVNRTVDIPYWAESMGVTTDGVVHVWTGGYAAYSLDQGTSWKRLSIRGGHWGAVLDDAMYYFNESTETLLRYTKETLGAEEPLPEVVTQMDRPETVYYSLVVDRDTKIFYLTGEEENSFFLRPINSNGKDIFVAYKKNYRGIIEGLYAKNNVFYLGLKQLQGPGWAIKIDNGAYTRSEAYGASPVFLGEANNSVFFGTEYTFSSKVVLKSKLK